SPTPRTGSRKETSTSRRTSHTLTPKVAARLPAIPAMRRSGPRRKPRPRRESKKFVMSSTIGRHSGPRRRATHLDDGGKPEVYGEEEGRQQDGDQPPSDGWATERYVLRGRQLPDAR